VRAYLRLAVLLLGARPAFAQIRVEAFAPRLSPAPALSITVPSFPSALNAPSLAAPAPLFAAAPSVLAAPAPSAIPATPLAVAASGAAADGPARPGKDALSSIAKAAAPGDDEELPSRSLNNFWDGLSLPEQDEPLFALPPASGVLPEAAGAASRGESAAPWLALTKAGRRAFAGAERVLDAAGATLPVDVLDLGRNYGEYDYLEGRLRLDRKLFAPGREAELAGTLAHELVHVAQHAQGLISNALELEIEAHLLDLELMDELGLEPPANTFARQAREALKKSPKAFIELMQAAVPGSPFLGESDFEDIAEQLEQDLDGLSRKKSARAAKLAASVANDLDLIRSKKGRAAYKEFSQRVLAELARRSAAAR
jgi:hypothetical protein